MKLKIERTIIRYDRPVPGSTAAFAEFVLKVYPQSPNFILNPQLNFKILHLMMTSGMGKRRRFYFLLLLFLLCRFFTLAAMKGKCLHFSVSLEWGHVMTDPGCTSLNVDHFSGLLANFCEFVIPAGGLKGGVDTSGKLVWPWP